jgi:hypothetical protein
MHAFLIFALTSIDLYILHLVRDPRGVVFSWMRNADPGALEPRPEVAFGTRRLLSVATTWSLHNLAIELLPTVRTRRLLIRYEDFASSPVDVVAGICDFLGEPPAEMPSSIGAALDLGDKHMVSGNRSRYVCGHVEIRPDDAWRRALPLGIRALGSLPTVPLMARYGYSIRANRARRLSP